MIPKSGGDYAYISDAFGPLPAFLYLWVALFVLVPTGNAITALTFAQYILQPAWPGCEPPYEAVRLLAAVITCKRQINRRHRARGGRADERETELNDSAHSKSEYPNNKVPFMLLRSCGE